MTDARARILARLRGAPVVAAPPKVDAPDTTIAPADRLGQFRTMLESVNGELITAPRDNWVRALATVLHDSHVATLAFGPVGPYGDQLAGELGTHSKVQLVPYDRPIEDFRETLFSVDAGITSVRGGIAETGSLVLWPDATEPRLLSLVPPLHIALLDIQTLHDTFAHVMAMENWADGMPTNALLVSGPSKTADIEHTLIYGVHGPKRLVVVVLVD